MITLTQAGVAFFGVMMLILTFVQYARKKMFIRGVFLWSLLWLGLFFGALLFDQIQAFSINVLEVQNIDLFVILAIIVIFIIIFSISNQMRNMNKRMSEIMEGITKIQYENRKKEK